MKDDVLLQAREQVFENYRSVLAEMDVLKEQIADDRAKLNDKQQAYASLNKTHEYLQKLITTMIRHDCDPVTAKLRYEDELEIEQEKYPKAATTVTGGGGSAYKYPGDFLP